MSRKILTKLEQKISRELIETIFLLKALRELIDGDGTKDIIIKIMLKKTRLAFHTAEKCRKMLMKI